MTELLKSLCEADATAGDEGAVRDIILSEISGKCDARIDAAGNILVEKQGKKRSAVRLMLDAHTDEVGLIISGATPEGFLKFALLGGIETAALFGRRVRINGKIPGIIGLKPIHLLHGDEGKKLPEVNTLCIDIGASDSAQALNAVPLGSRAVVEGEWAVCGENILSKALDDRIGCAVLAALLSEDSEYDFCASFSSSEEIGTRGARVAAYTLNPQAAVVLEGTTASDIAGSAPEKQVCVLGKGPAVSFMDRGTVYDRAYYNAALGSGILCQTKAAVAGGNDSSAIHLSRSGVRTIAISAPCRYIHTAVSAANIRDIEGCAELARYMINGICSGDIR